MQLNCIVIETADQIDEHLFKTTSIEWKEIKESMQIKRVFNMLFYKININKLKFIKM